MRCTTALHPRRMHRRWHRAFWVLVAFATATIALAQGTPSGEYGALPLGSAVDGTLVGVVGDEVVVYHTYTVALPAGAGAVTVAVEGFGHDLDLALKLGAPIVDYADVDHLDVSEDPNPTYTFTAAAAGVLYVDVLNLLPQPVAYRLTVSTAGAGPAATTDDPVLARGVHGVLTQDDALAFVEALEFSAAQAGLVQGFGEEDRLLVLQTLAENFAALQPHEQALLTQAREVWSRAQANWPTATQAEREEFVLGVFVLAFGEEAVRQATAGGGGRGGAGGGGGSSCATIDDCMSTYAPDTYQDTVNARGCWAAAGCSDYDPVDNSFTYESYDSY